MTIPGVLPLITFSRLSSSDCFASADKTAWLTRISPSALSARQVSEPGFGMAVWRT